MLGTYKSRCCLNCRFADCSGRECEDTMICRYDEAHTSYVKCDDVCAGWESETPGDLMAFQKPVEDSVVKTYDVAMRITVKGRESQMRYADKIMSALKLFADDDMAGVEIGDGHEIMHASVESVKVYDPESE